MHPQFGFIVFFSGKTQIIMAEDGHDDTVARMDLATYLDYVRNELVLGREENVAYKMWRVDSTGACDELIHAADYLRDIDVSYCPPGITPEELRELWDKREPIRSRNMIHLVTLENGTQWFYQVLRPMAPSGLCQLLLRKFEQGPPSRTWYDLADKVLTLSRSRNKYLAHEWIYELHSMGDDATTADTQLMFGDWSNDATDLNVNTGFCFIPMQPVLCCDESSYVLK